MNLLFIILLFIEYKFKSQSNLQKAECKNTFNALPSLLLEILFIKPCRTNIVYRPHEPFRLTATGNRKLYAQQKAIEYIT